MLMQTPPLLTSTSFHMELPFIRDNEIDADNGIRYTRTPTSKWTKVEFEEGDDEGGRTIDPIEWTGEKEKPVNITDEELNSLRDVNGEIRFEKVFEWILPRFGVDDSETSYSFGKLQG